MPDLKPSQNANDALEKHLSDPAEKTEQVSGEQERARRSAESPTEPSASTEQQPICVSETQKAPINPEAEWGRSDLSRRPG